MVKYLTAWQNNLPLEMYKLLSAADREDVSEEEYLAQFEEFPLRPSAHALKKIYFVEDGLAAVYDIAWPDFSTDQNVLREEDFFLVKEGPVWRIKEEVSLMK